MSAGDMPAGENAAVLFVDDEAGVLTGRRRFPVAGRILLTGFTGSGLQEEVMGKGLARRILSPTQLLLTRWGGTGNEKAYVGREGWLFYRPTGAARSNEQPGLRNNR